MSPSHRRCDSTGSTLRPMILVLRLSNSGLSAATAPSSVVQTGVKSLGCENRTAQEFPFHSWKETLPCVVSAVKSGASSPRRIAIVPLLWGSEGILRVSPFSRTRNSIVHFADGTVRRHRDRGRPRRRGSIGAGGAHGSAHVAAHAEPRDDRPDVVQSGDRWDRERDGRPRGRCPRWHHGAGDRPGPDPVPHAQPVEGARGLGSAGAVRSGPVPGGGPRHAGAAGTAAFLSRDGVRLPAGWRTSRRCHDAGRTWLRRWRHSAYGGYVPSRPDAPGNRPADSRGPGGRAGRRR